MRITFIVLASISATITICGCQTAPRKNENAPPRPVTTMSMQSGEQQVVLQFRRYENAIRYMRYDDAADIFAADGVLEHVGANAVNGREAIRAYLRSFAGYTVLEHSMTIDTSAVADRAAQQAGRYAQRVETPDRTSVKVSGSFNVRWQRSPDGIWQITHMQTRSAR